MRGIFAIARMVIKELIRRKDFYLILVLFLIALFYIAFISFGDISGFQRYFKEGVISMAYIFSMGIGIAFAARQIPQEVEMKTIYPVLAHPISRLEFILGKFLGVLLVAITSFSVYYLSFVTALYARGDFSTPPLLLIEGFALHCLLLSFFVSLTILLSLFLSVTANAGISILLYFGANWFGAGAPGSIFLPHPELFDIKEKIIHTSDIVPLWAVAFLAIYAVIYTAIFISLSYAVFKKRNL